MLALGECTEAGISALPPLCNGTPRGAHTQPDATSLCVIPISLCVVIHICSASAGLTCIGAFDLELTLRLA